MVKQIVNMGRKVLTEGYGFVYDVCVRVCVCVCVCVCVFVCVCV